MKAILDKLSSGRFLFTIVCAIVFAAMSLTGKLPQDKVMEVILVVVYAYFTRSSGAKGMDNSKSPNGSV